MKKSLILCICLFCFERLYCWGFYAHQQINFFAVFLLPPEMMVFYKPNISFLHDHAVDPDKRRYLLASEGSRHFIDIDHYGSYPFPALPRKWEDALRKYSADTLTRYGIVPWWIPIMQKRLTRAFSQGDRGRILKLSAEIGHYIADAHVPLHVCSNHNGQLTDQQGIHAFWESRIPELLAEKEWDFFIGKAEYISDPSAYIWKRVLESAAASDTVLRYEKELAKEFKEESKFAFGERNGRLVRQYAAAYAEAYDRKLNHMVERRMRLSIAATASFWYTAWVDAGQPDLKSLARQEFSEEELKEFEFLDQQWKKSGQTDDECPQGTGTPLTH